MLSHQEIIKFIKSLYFIRDKRLNEEFLPIWIREISIRQPDIAMLKQVQNQLINDDTIQLTITSICKLIDQLKREITINALTYNSQNCPYCHGTGIATITAKFDNAGKFIGTNTALKCRCSQSKQNFLQMTDNAATNNKTQTDGGYYLVFETVVQRDEYLKNLSR